MSFNIYVEHFNDLIKKHKIEMREVTIDDCSSAAFCEFMNLVLERIEKQEQEIKTLKEVLQGHLNGGELKINHEI